VTSFDCSWRILRGNSASTFGGAILADGQTNSFDNCTFRNNFAGFGGAVSVTSIGRPACVSLTHSLSLSLTPPIQLDSIGMAIGMAIDRTRWQTTTTTDFTTVTSSTTLPISEEQCTHKRAHHQQSPPRLSSIIKLEPTEEHWQLSNRREPTCTMSHSNAMLLNLQVEQSSVCFQSMCRVVSLSLSRVWFSGCGCEKAHEVTQAMQHHTTPS